MSTDINPYDYFRTLSEPPISDDHRVSDVTVPGHPVFSNQRHCINCTYKNNCWSGQIEDEFDDLDSNCPEEFRLRAPDWNRDRFVRHMQGIYAQLCDTFRFADASLQVQREGRVQRNLEKTGQNEWDS